MPTQVRNDRIDRRHLTLVPLSSRTGFLAAALSSGAIIAALVAVILRAGGQFSLGPGDVSAILFTLHQAFWSAALSVLFAVPLARALARRTFPGRRALIVLLGAPFVLPVVTAVIGLLIVFGRNGWVNDLLSFLGLPGFSIYGFQGVVLAHVFFNIPLATRLILSGWLSLPAERFRLVAQMGLPPSAVFRILEWPLLRRIVPGAFALIFVLCLTSFAVALTLGGGPRATTVELAIYEAFRFEFDLGRAAILSLVQIVMAGTAAAVAFWLVPTVQFGAGMDRPVARWDAQSHSLKAQDGVMIAAGALFLILPLLALTLRGMGGLFDLPSSIWPSVFTSIWVALVSTGIMIGLALPMAGWIATGRVGSVEALGILALAASPLMIGTGWFLIIYPFFDPADLAFWVTASVNALVALPFALRILVPPIKEALDSYGKLCASLAFSPLQTWRIVILPRCKPQIGFATGLTAALSAGDLGVITLFADPDRATLPLAMYRLTSAYRTDAAAGAALLLLVLALAMFWMFDAWGKRRA